MKLSTMESVATNFTAKTKKSIKLSHHKLLATKKPANINYSS